MPRLLDPSVSHHHLHKQNGVNKLTPPKKLPGETVGAKLAEKQKEMGATQREAQKTMMQEQMKKQMAMAIAGQREMLNWQFGTYIGFVTGVVVAKLKGASLPAAARVPLIIAPIIMAYQADMAYGNKADRIKAEADRILV